MCSFFSSFYPIQHLYPCISRFTSSGVQKWNCLGRLDGVATLLAAVCLQTLSQDRGSSGPSSLYYLVRLKLTTTPHDPRIFTLQEIIANGMENFHVGEQYQVVDVIGE
jgi:hypothetical protein